MLAQNQYASAISTLTECVTIQRNLVSEQELTFETAQTLLDLGRANQAHGNLKAALQPYLDVLVWSKTFFGEKHAFVARISSIIGNLYTKLGKESEAKIYLDESAEIEKTSTSSNT